MPELTTVPVEPGHSDGAAPGSEAATGGAAPGGEATTGGAAPAIEDDLRERLGRLSLEQKVRLVSGADAWSMHPEPAIGLRRLVVSDGPAGVRGEHWDERDPSANVPSPTALAASWDTERVARIGALLAGEARRKGVDVLLAPTVNLHRTPYGGRHFECYSEDPLLSAIIGAAYVRGLQAGGVGGCVKHFVANDSETERMTLDARVDERTLRELYLRPFETIVREAGVWSVMASYNGVNGHSMTSSPLLREVLHADWGFDGVVMSDWWATRSVAPAARAALDLAMPGPVTPWTDGELLDAVRAGEVDEAVLDDKVLRLLRLAARVGALDGVPPARPPATPWPDERVAAELRAAAAAGFVLARNEGGLLPLDRSTLRSVAVIGANAAIARTLGGGSATVFPPYTVSPLDGLRAALGDEAVRYEVGARPYDRLPLADLRYLRQPAGDAPGDDAPDSDAPDSDAPDSDAPGVEIRMLAADGTVLRTQRRTRTNFSWLGGFGPGIPAGAVERIEMRTRVVAIEPGRYTLAHSGVGQFRFRIGEQDLGETWVGVPEGEDPSTAWVLPPQRVHTVDLAAGEQLEVEVGYQVDRTAVGAGFQFNLEPPHPDPAAELDRAVAAAAAADVAIVVVGTTEQVESEGFDRTSLALPGRQDDLVRRVVAANPRTVVIVNSGSPVLLPWLAEVPAVLLSWFPGQEFGNALADVLLGATEPCGRLPTTWPVAEGAVLPSSRPVDGVLEYVEGPHIGYRRFARDGVPPMFWFGHGLGYTTWEYDQVQAPADVTAGQDVCVRVGVRNTGARRGREVVQVYASRPDRQAERPVRWLAGFAAVDADPGGHVTAEVRVPARVFEHWDAASGGWASEPGPVTLTAARSAGSGGPSATVRIVPAG